MKQSVDPESIRVRRGEVEKSRMEKSIEKALGSVMSWIADTRLNLITDSVDRRRRMERSEGLGNRRKCPEIVQVLSRAERAE